MDDKGIVVERNISIKNVEEDLIDNFTSGVYDIHMVNTFAFTSNVSNILCTDQVVAQSFNEGPPIFYEYEEDSDKQISTSAHIEYPINGPMYDNYASNSFKESEVDEKAIQLDEDFIVCDVPAIEVDESNLMPSHSDDYCAYAKFDKEYYAP
jgi:hypothetical protein